MREKVACAAEIMVIISCNVVIISWRAGKHCYKIVQNICSGIIKMARKIILDKSSL